ncbi:hypothetical protein EDD86DRAFT_206804 [Gorgonomyces haynaldii]|nr:hypothetical protein EDD86DRAFT_206804 [Gorgonomyces haynaldii]
MEGYMVLAYAATASIVSYMVASCLILLLLSSGYEKTRRPYIFMLHFGSILHGGLILYLAHLKFTGRSPPEWSVILVTFYGFFQVIISLWYSIILISLFKPIYPAITEYKLNVARVAVVVCHFITCFPIYVKIFTGRAELEYAFLKTWYTYGIITWIFTGFLFDLAQSGFIGYLLYLHVADMFRGKQELKTKLQRQIYFRINVALWILFLWDLIGFVCFAFGEATTKNETDTPLTGNLKFFAVGTAGWHFCGMTFLFYLLKNWFASTVTGHSNKASPHIFLKNALVNPPSAIFESKQQSTFVGTGFVGG